MAGANLTSAVGEVDPADLARAGIVINADDVQSASETEGYIDSVMRQTIMAVCVWV